jgi:L-lactate dehydrogenase complex protein LldE
MIVDLFIPCFVDQIYPDTAVNMVKILEKLNIGVNYNQEQTCCGQPAFNGGYWEQCREVGEKFIRDFPNDRPIVAPSASCVGMTQNYYGELFHNSSLHNQFKTIQ